MKILYYIHSLYVGGAETLVASYIVKLKESNNDVILVVNNKVDNFLSQKLINSGIKIISLNKHRQSRFLKYFELAFRKIFGYSNVWKKIYREEKPDIVHIHTFCDAFEICDMDPKKIFYTFHSNVSRSFAIGSKKNNHKLYKYAQMGMNFTALSQTMISDIKERLMTEDVFYIPNAIDLKEIRSFRYDKEEFLLKNELPVDSFIVGHVGRFHPIKNHEKLFSVFHAVHKKCPSARLILVGTGTFQETEHIEYLKKKYGVSDVTLMLGLRPDATAIMSIFDAFVLTSLNESFSLVLVEAEAQGVRCITSNVVPQEVICENCIALDLNDSDEIWAEEILSSKPYKSCNSIEQFDIQSIIDTLIKIYSEAITDK